MELIPSALTAMGPVRKDHIKQDSAMCTQPRGGALSSMSNTYLTGGGCLHRGVLTFPFSSPSHLEVPPLWWTGVRWQTQIISWCDLGQVLSELGGHASHPPEFCLLGAHRRLYSHDPGPNHGAAQFS